MTRQQQLLQRLDDISQSIAVTGKALALFLPGYDRLAESAQALLSYLDQHYIIQQDIKRVILAACQKQGNHLRGAIHERHAGCV